MANHGASDVPAIYHAVRKLAYFSSGDRSPEAVMRDGRGACTAKHILLRDLLRRQGEAAEVVLVSGDFAKGVPQAASMQDPLRAMIRDAGVADFHCYVVWQNAGHAVRLDATWPDVLAPYGFPVNIGWTGVGDTALAISPDAAIQRAEDAIAAKAQLLLGLNVDEAAKRLRFLKLLSDFPEITIEVMRVLAARLTQTTSELSAARSLARPN